jgi:hypothetical protein
MREGETLVATDEVGEGRKRQCTTGGDRADLYERNFTCLDQTNFATCIIF